MPRNRLGDLARSLGSDVEVGQSDLRYIGASDRTRIGVKLDHQHLAVSRAHILHSDLSAACGGTTFKSGDLLQLYAGRRFHADLDVVGHLLDQALHLFAEDLVHLLCRVNEMVCASALLREGGQQLIVEVET